MKMHRYPKVYWWIIGMIFLMTLVSCRSTARKPEPTPSQPPSAPSEPATAPQKSSPPQRTSPPPSKPAPPPREAAPLPSEKSLLDETYFTHTVKHSGETISIIAAWYTGDLDNWKVLAEVITKNNPNADIKRIYVGNKILIPENLLKTRETMPQEFVDSFYKKSKPEKVAPKPVPSEAEEEPKLFGPKELPKK
jgi:Tfp pilus assembly protein FimV